MRLSRRAETSGARALEARLWASNLIPEAMGTFGGLETGQRVRAVFDSNPLAAKDQRKVEQLGAAFWSPGDSDKGLN